MGLEKAIKHNKEHRKPFRKAKAVDKSCRNHGGDPWAESDRLHKFQKREKTAEQKEKEFTEKP